MLACASRGINQSLSPFDSLFLLFFLFSSLSSFFFRLVPPLNVARFHLFSFPRFHPSTFISLSVRFFHLFPPEPCRPSFQPDPFSLRSPALLTNARARAPVVEPGRACTVQPGNPIRSYVCYAKCSLRSQCVPAGAIAEIWRTKEKSNDDVARASRE